MYIHSPKKAIETTGAFRFSKNLNLAANVALRKPVFKELFRNFCSQNIAIEFLQTDELVFSAGKAAKPSLDGNDYAFVVTEDGFCATAKDEKSLKLAFFALAERIECVENEKFSLPCGTFLFTPSVRNRMVHFCLFPETRLHFFKKCLRSAAFLGFTHVVVEFWGTYRFDSLPELAWKEKAFEKSELKALFNEANELGLEIIPMFNQWGHASASRVMQGKHVVLDQAPKYAYLFDRTGWNWAIEKRETKLLQEQVRTELIELCGSGKYFHIGCDEAYGFDYSKKSLQDFIEHVNEISASLKKQGRRAIMWGDMLLCRFRQKTKNPYSTNCPNEEVQAWLIDRLDKDIVIADWQYNAKEYPVETALFFQEHGFDTLLCPWDRSFENISVTSETARTHDLFGVLHTTWHTLSQGTPRMFQVAKILLGDKEKEDSYLNYASVVTETAALQRKLCPAETYEDAGFSSIQTPDLT